MEKVMRYQVADYLNTGDSTETYTLMGAGFNSLDESPSAQTESTTYINDKSATKYVKGYETTFPFDTDLIADETAITFIYDIARNQKVGEDAETDYVRVELFSPVASKDNTYKARKFKVSVEVSDITGEGASIMKVSGNLNGVGDFIDGEFNTTTKTFTAAGAVQA